MSIKDFVEDYDENYELETNHEILLENMKFHTNKKRYILILEEYLSNQINAYKLKKQTVLCTLGQWSGSNTDSRGGQVN